MSWIVAIIVGAIIGWIASMIMATDRQMGALYNVIIGVVGAVAGRWLFGSVLSIGATSSATITSFWALVWGVVGSVILIAILKAFKVFQ